MNGRQVVYFGIHGLQLRDVHRVSVCQTCGEVGDLSCFIRRTNRNSAVSGFPCRIVRCRCFIRGGIVPENTRSGSRLRTGTQSDAAFDADVGVIAENGDVRCCGFPFCFQRTDDDISVHIFQLVVVAHDDVMTRVGDGVSVARHDVVGYFRRARSVIMIRIGNFVAYAGNLRIESSHYHVTVTFDADMASSFFKETNRAVLILRIIEVLLFLLIFIRQRFGIIRVIHKVTCATDKCPVGVFYNVLISENAVFPTRIFLVSAEKHIIIADGDALFKLLFTGIATCTKLGRAITDDNTALTYSKSIIS